MDRQNFSNKDLIFGQDIERTLKIIYQDQLPLQIFSVANNKLLFNTTIAAINNKAHYFDVNADVADRTINTHEQDVNVTTVIDSTQLIFNTKLIVVEQTRQEHVSLKFPELCYCHQERRRAPRVITTDSVITIINNERTIAGTINNISVMGILCTFPIKASEVFQKPFNAKCKLVLTGNRILKVECEINIIRINKNEEKQAMSVAGEFNNLTENDREQLKAYIEQQQQDYKRFFDKE